MFALHKNSHIMYLCPADENGEQTTIWKYNTWIHIATSDIEEMED